jgi:hypothetical protein
VNKKKNPDWLTIDFILGYFNGNEISPHKRYEDFVRAKMIGTYESPLTNTVASTILGSDNFIDNIKERYLNVKEKDRDLPALRELAVPPNINEIYNIVISETNDNPFLIRNCTLYLSRNHSEKTLKEIGNFFGISEAAVSQANYRFCYRLAKDRQLRIKINRLKKRLDILKV